MSIQRKDADVAAQSFISFKDFEKPFMDGFLKEFGGAGKLPTASLTFVNNNFSLAVLKKVQWAERWIINAATGASTSQKRAAALGSGYGAFFGALEYGICCEKFDAQDKYAALVPDSVDGIIKYLKTLNPVETWRINFVPLNLRILAIVSEHPALKNETKVMLQEIAQKFNG